MELKLPETSEDAFDTLDLVLEEDIAANLDHFILLSRLGFFEEANAFFEAYLKRHASWFAIVWEYCNCRPIQNRAFDPEWYEFLRWANESFVYSSEETALLRLMVNGVSSLDDHSGRLLILLGSKSLEDIDVMTILTIVRILNHYNQHPYDYPTQFENLKPAALTSKLESYCSTLVKTGYLWEAYAIISADTIFESGNKLLLLKAMSDAISRPDFVPVEYGLDATTCHILETNIQVCIGLELLSTMLGDWTITTFQGTFTLKYLTTTVQKLRDCVPILPNRLTLDGLRWASPRQQLDYEYVSIMERWLTGSIQLPMTLQVLQGLYDEANSTNYARMASNIDYTKDLLHIRLPSAPGQEVPPDTALPQSSRSTLATDQAEVAASTAIPQISPQPQAPVTSEPQLKPQGQGRPSTADIEAEGHAAALRALRRTFLPIASEPGTTQSLPSSFSPEYPHVGSPASSLGPEPLPVPVPVPYILPYRDLSQEVKTAAFAPGKGVSTGSVASATLETSPGPISPGETPRAKRSFFSKRQSSKTRPSPDDAIARKWSKAKPPGIFETIMSKHRTNTGQPNAQQNHEGREATADFAAGLAELDGAEAESERIRQS